MCEELAKLMEPEMREAKRIAEEEGRKAGMKAGMEQGLQAGMEQGLQAGMEQGLQAGMEQGLQAGMEQGLQEGRKEGEQAGINLSITIINQLRDGKNIEEIAKETGAAVNVIETICKSLGLE